MTDTQYGSHVPWTAAEQEIAERLRAEGSSYYAIAKVLGRDRGTVRCRLDPGAQLAARARARARREQEAIERGVPFRRVRLPRPWTDADLATASQLRQQGLSYERIGLHLGRGKTEVRRRLNPGVEEGTRSTHRRYRAERKRQVKEARHRQVEALYENITGQRPSSSSVPSYGRHNHWSDPEYEGLKALAVTTPRLQIPEAYKAWATEHGYFNGRRRESLLKLLDEGQIQCPDPEPWSGPELQQLRRLADEYPPTELARVWHIWAQTTGRPYRNRDELIQAAREHLGIDPITPTSAWWTAEAVAEVLELSPVVISSLCIMKRLRSLREPDGRWFVHTLSFRQLAKRDPTLLAGASRFGILALTGRADLADALCTPHPAPLLSGG